MYGGSFGYGSSLGNNSSLFNLESAGIWVIISFVIALVGGICLYFTVFSDKNEKSYTGFMAKLYEFSLVLLSIHENVSEINRKMKK